MTSRKFLTDMFRAIARLFMPPNDGGHLVHEERTAHISPYLLMLMPPRR
jgi:hypothetical protein